MLKVTLTIDRYSEYYPSVRNGHGYRHSMNGRCLVGARIVTYYAQFRWHNRVICRNTHSMLRLVMLVDIILDDPPSEFEVSLGWVEFPSFCIGHLNKDELKLTSKCITCLRVVSVNLCNADDGLSIPQFDIHFCKSSPPCTLNSKGTCVECHDDGTTIRKSSVSCIRVLSRSHSIVITLPDNVRASYGETFYEFRFRNHPCLTRATDSIEVTARKSLRQLIHLSLDFSQDGQINCMLLDNLQNSAKVVPEIRHSLLVDTARYIKQCKRTQHSTQEDSPEVEHNG